MKPVMICLVGRGLNMEGEFISSARVGKDEVAKVLRENNGFRTHSFALPLKQTCQVLFGLSEDQMWSDAIKNKPIAHWDLSFRQLTQRLGTEGGRDVFDKDLWAKMAEEVWEDVQAEKPFKFNLVTKESITDAPPTGDDNFDFIFERAAQVLFHITDTEAAYSKAHGTAVCALGLSLDQIKEKLKYETLPAVLDLPFNDAWAKFCAVRPLFPTVLTASMGPYGMPPLVANGLVIPDGRFPNELDTTRNNGGTVCFVERILPDNVEKVVGHSSETELPILPGDYVIKNEGGLQELHKKINDFLLILEETPSLSI